MVRRVVALWVIALSGWAVPARAGDERGSGTGWKPGGGVSIVLPNFELRLGARFQGRFTYDDQEYCGDCISTLDMIEQTDVATGVTAHVNTAPVTSVLGDPVTGDSLTSTNFAVRRLKAYFLGWAFDPRFQYDIQFESVAGTKNNNIGLREAAIDLQFRPQLQLKIGQWKGPFGRQRIMSDGNQQFVDLAIATESFAMGFEDGVMLHGTFGGGKNDRFEYNLGVFNGSGQNPPLTGEIDRKPLWAARFVYMPLGKYDYAESSPDNPDHLLLFVGGSWNTNTQTSSVRAMTSGSESEAETEKVGMEVGGKYKIFNFAAEYFGARVKIDTRTFDPAATASTSAVLVSRSQEETNPRGWYAQVGLFALPKILEFALRASESNPNRDFSHQETKEMRLGVNWLLSKGHPHKLQADFGTLTREFNGTLIEGNPGSPSSDNRKERERQLRIQYQFWF